MTAAPPISALTPCAFKAVWPTLHLLRCDYPGCPGTLEFWVAQEITKESGVRGMHSSIAVSRVAAGAGWMCVVTRRAGGGAASQWLCRDCGREMVDPKHPEIVEASEVRAHQSRIDVTLMPLTGMTSPIGPE